MDVLLQLCESMGIMKKYLWVSGLKDKKAITRQWISLPLSAVDMVGGKDVVVDLLQQYDVQVLQTQRYDQPLCVGGNEGNHFKIRLQAQKSVTQEIKARIQQESKRIQTHGFPNYYGLQRFGKGLRNFKRAETILSGKEFTPGSYVSKFILQAYGNFYFNRYVYHRRNDKKYIIEGDIFVNQFHHVWARIGYLVNQKIHIIDTQELLAPRGPEAVCIDNFKNIRFEDAKNRIPTWSLLWSSQLLPKHNSLSYIYETQNHYDLYFNTQKNTICQHYGMIGKRRPLWVTPSSYSFAFDGDDILLSFFLPTGSYATVLVSTLLANIDEASIVGNKLRIAK